MRSVLPSRRSARNRSVSRAATKPLPTKTVRHELESDREFAIAASAEQADYLLRLIVTSANDEDREDDDVPIPEFQVRWVVRASRLYVAGQHRKLGLLLQAFERLLTAAREHREGYKRAHGTLEARVGDAEREVMAIIPRTSERKAAKARRAKP